MPDLPGLLAQWNADAFMRRVDVVEQAKFDASRAFGKIAKLTPWPSQVAPSGYGFPGQVLTVVISVTFLSLTRTQRAIRDSSRSLAEFVAQKNRQQAQTDHASNHQRARGWFWHGEEQEERLHCFDSRL